MLKNEVIKDLLQREMTRKEFLRVVGLAVLTLFGVSNMLKSMEQTLVTKKTATQKNLDEYGESAYGG